MLRRRFPSSRSGTIAARMKELAVPSTSRSSGSRRFTGSWRRTSGASPGVAERLAKAHGPLRPVVERVKAGQLVTAKDIKGMVEAQCLGILPGDVLYGVHRLG